MQKLPRLLHFLVNLLLLEIVMLGLFRLAFWIWFKNPSDPIPTPDLLHSFYLGFKFDLRLVLMTLLPLFVLGGLRWLSPFESRLMRNLWFGYLAAVYAVIILFYFMNFGYYAYLHTPMDATVLRFAYNFSTSMTMLWETYPMIWIVLGLALFISAYVWVLHRLLWRAETYANPRLHGWRKALVASLGTVLLIFGLYGKFSWYPLRWSEAFAMPHAFAPAVAMNPVLYFLNTIKNREVSFDTEATRAAYPLMASYLGVTDPDKTRLNYTRIIDQPGPLVAQRPNIVMVFLESFASYKTGVFGNPLDPTPNFDALARDAISFSRYYAPHTGTARSVWAAITGIPDVESSKTSTRNPLIVNQHTIVNAFKGYEKFYFLGGSANWGNIRGLLQHNIPGLHVYEEGSYTSPRIDVWGISDLDLFKEADRVLAKSKKPFFAVIQTSGNHRPYTIPEDNHGFKLIQHDEQTLHDAGFMSNKEYNSFRFMDHSIGYFMAQARKSNFFDDTIFVFYGDHGITGYGGKQTPEFESKFILTGFHTPLLIFAPKLLPAQKLDKIASEVDLLPTLAGLAAPGYTDTTLGRDLLDPRFDNKHYAFTITHYTNPEIGLIGPDHYFRMYADGTNKLLIDTSSDHPTENVIADQPEVAASMEALTRGIYETAKYMRFHNANP
jgi:phosphoglycerol transferase MdoB-like AlkP superfamily enzyme